jgi:hypothetical protein
MAEGGPSAGRRRNPREPLVAMLVIFARCMAGAGLFPGGGARMPTPHGGQDANSRTFAVS